MKQHDKYRDDVNDDLDDILHAHKVLPFSGVHPGTRSRCGQVCTFGARFHPSSHSVSGSVVG